MKKIMSSVNWRLGLMALIAAFAVMLMGADYPEYDRDSKTALSIARSLCDELAPGQREEMKQLAAKNPVWLLQTLD